MMANEEKRDPHRPRPLRRRSRRTPSGDAYFTRGIGAQLRAVFQEVVDEPVPQHLLDLVEALKAGRKGPGNLDS